MGQTLMPGVIKEFRCAVHGDFEASHPICPAYGCRSESVERVFLTAPVIGTGVVRRTEAGMAETAARLGITNWKSAQRPGDVSFHGRGAQAVYSGGDAPLGTEVLWGDASVQKVMGKPLAQMAGETQRQLDVGGKAAGDAYTRVNNGMRATANTTRIFNGVLPAAEIKGSKSDQADRARVVGAV